MQQNWDKELEAIDTKQSGLPPRILNLYSTKWALLVFVCFSFSGHAC